MTQKTITVQHRLTNEERAAAFEVLGIPQDTEQTYGRGYMGGTTPEQARAEFLRIFGREPSWWRQGAGDTYLLGPVESLLRPVTPITKGRKRR